MKFPKKSLFFTLAACMGLVITSCKEDITVSVKTYSVYQVTNSSASVNGSVSMVGDDIEESGFLLSTSPTLTLTYLNSNRYESTGSLSEVKVTFTGLAADSSYRYRLYAKTDDSIYYGATYYFMPGSVVLTTELVDGGSYQMGGSSEQATYAKENEFPVHAVALNGFRIGTTEVTNAQFMKFLMSRKITFGGTGLTASGVTKTFLFSNLHGLHYDLDSAAWNIEPGFENHPVVRVTWYGASEFCRWAGGRLPTEAEWEWAARGGMVGRLSSSIFVLSGGNLADSTTVAWYKFNTKTLPEGHRDTQPVATKTKNSLNLYDMSGNAWEWVADWYNLYLPLSQSNPKGMSDADALESGVTDKVRRGGGWADEDVNALRVSRRDHNLPELNLGSCGFRFAKDL
ncbi:MAG: SUMF1/EgtB/PvdO family nonheme iron enzyme [Bacteroidia bacterium]|nr:SUMF1/EgtB/PvdO family nonheme iron enzyme [Bacteroidia bacterium]